MQSAGSRHTRFRRCGARAQYCGAQGSCPAACRTLVPGAGIEPVSTALARWILNRWTAREVPSDWLLIPEVFFPCWSLIQMKSYIMNIMFVWWSRVLPARWLVPLSWYLVSHSMNLQLESIIELTSFSNYPLFILLPFNPFTSWSFQVVLVVESPAARAGDLRDVSLISGSRRSPGGGQHNPLQYSCLENPMDRGAWRATVHGLAKSWTWLEQLSTHETLLTPSIARLPVDGTKKFKNGWEDSGTINKQEEQNSFFFLNHDTKQPSILKSEMSAYWGDNYSSSVLAMRLLLHWTFSQTRWFHGRGHSWDTRKFHYTCYSFIISVIIVYTYYKCDSNDRASFLPPPSPQSCPGESKEHVNCFC